MNGAEAHARRSRAVPAARGGHVSICTNAVATHAIASAAPVPAVASARSMDAPRIDLRTIATSQPAAMSRLDLRATHEATKNLATKEETTRIGTASGVAAVSADSGGDTRLAGNVADTVAVLGGPLTR